MGKATKTALMGVYLRLLKTFGPQKWWPAQTKFEVIIGAILTQNTNWGNVEKALNNLKSKDFLSSQAIKNISHRKLAALIKPAGYFNVKAKRIKNFISFLFKEYGGRLEKMARKDHALLRRQLLDVNGIGPETADSILLYALDKPVFVVDAYTKRILYRHNMAERKDDYHAIQSTFMAALKHDVAMFNEYHALIVRLGKDYCRPKPACEECPLNHIHYSLTHRCGRCFKALLKPEQRVVRSGVFCLNCIE